MDRRFELSHNDERQRAPDQVSAAPGRRWFHYTVPFAALQIIGEGGLRPQGWERLRWIDGKVELLKGTSFSVSDAFFSSREPWDPELGWRTRDETTRSERLRSPAEIIQEFGALTRIEVPERVTTHTFPEYGLLAEMSNRYYKYLQSLALRAGSDPRLWRVSTNRVRVSDFIAIEASVGYGWLLAGVPAPDGNGVILQDWFLGVLATHYIRTRKPLT